MPSKSLRYCCVPGLILLASGCSRQLPFGQVTATNNPQVAMYTANAPANARVAVEFGVDTNYGLTTWSQSAPLGGGPVSIFVAGMRALTVYHIRGIIESSDGSKLVDADQTFTTGALPNAQLPNVKVTTASGMRPQSGVEMVNLLSLNTPVPVFATDISGNLIWSYQFQRSLGETIQPIKLLANGHLLVVISPGSTTPIATPPPPRTVDSLREIDLAGDTIREITIDDLNKRLASAGFDLTVSVFHHDVLPLANGHWIALTNTVKQFTDLPGFSGKTKVLGDVLVDLDEKLNPVWVWNEFDHLDDNRHPFVFPDWTHTNAVIYSDDGNLMVSIRHQSWLVKVDYENGIGNGNILWRLGNQGDFTLQGGIDPTDWFYFQHGPSFTTSNTFNKFSLVLFDNGDDRVLPPNTTCQSLQVASCPYSTVPIWDIDETAKTATLAFHHVTPQFSDFGGNAEVLQNGDIEFDETDSIDFFLLIQTSMKLLKRATRRSCGTCTSRENSPTGHFDCQAFTLGCSGKNTSNRIVYALEYGCPNAAITFTNLARSIDLAGLNLS